MVFWHLYVKKEFGMVGCTKSPEGPQNSERFSIFFLSFFLSLYWEMPFPANNTCSVLHRMHVQLQLLMAWTKKGETKYVRGRGRACPVKARLSKLLPNHFQEVNVVIQIRWLDQHISCFC